MNEHGFYVLSTPPLSPRKVLTRREGLKVVRRFLHELETQSLEVVLIPSRDADVAAHGGMIRCVQLHNPGWYRDFCSQYTAWRGRLSARDEWCGGYHKVGGRCPQRTHGPRRGRRKHDTAIKRRDTIRGLNELLDGRCESVYAHRLRDFIRENWFKYT